MELKLDPQKIYAVALEGGGARGAYQVGAWRALEEAGIRYNAVSGTSVGALNGAMMAMGDLQQAEKLWREIRFSQVMNVDDRVMESIFNWDFRSIQEFREAMKALRQVVQDRGFDIEPLRNLVAQQVDEEKLLSSGVEFFLTTYSLTDRQELEVDAKDLAPGELQEMLLASAYFPAFKQEKIGGKNYTDGGVYDAVPISALIHRGYQDLIVIRIYGFGIEKRVKIPSDVTIHTIAPEADLGNLLNFSRDQSQHNMALGYFDAQRMLYGLYGKQYYIDRTMSETDAYRQLCQLVWKDCSLRELNEEHLPQLFQQLRCKGDYYDLFIALLERVAQCFDLTPLPHPDRRRIFRGSQKTLRYRNTGEKPPGAKLLFPFPARIKKRIQSDPLFYILLLLLHTK